MIMPSLNGKTALVTGASRGMGRASALALASAGVALGVVGCLALRRVLAGLLFGIGPNDPSTIAAAVGVLLAVTFAAAFIPAWRAMRTDPVVALREE